MTIPLALIADPDVEAELRRQLAVEAWQDGYELGLVDGAAAQATAYKRALLGRYRDAQLEAARWTVLCGPCRRNGRRDGCTRCEVRTREDFGRSHPDDFQGQPG